MAISSNPYIHFPENNCREAMTFYGAIFGAAPQILPLGDMEPDTESPELVMHAELKTDEVTIMASDNCSGEPMSRGGDFMIALVGGQEDANKLVQYFDQLAVGGQVFMPVEQQPWGAVFGMLKDRFGVSWSINAG